MNTAIDIIAEREKTHGPWAVTAKISQELKAVVGNWAGSRNCHMQREAVDMILTKIARIVAGNSKHADHWRDIAGYAELGAKDCVE